MEKVLNNGFTEMEEEGLATVDGGCCCCLVAGGVLATGAVAAGTVATVATAATVATVVAVKAPLICCGIKTVACGVKTALSYLVCNPCK